MSKEETVRDNLNAFFDAVAELKEIGAAVGDELLSVLLLYSLSASYETLDVQSKRETNCRSQKCFA